jgi:hypothetical protein
MRDLSRHSAAHRQAPHAHRRGHLVRQVPRGVHEFIAELVLAPRRQGGRRLVLQCHHEQLLKSLPREGELGQQPHADPAPDAYSASNPHADPEANPRPDTDSGPSPDTDTDSDTDSGPSPDADAGTGTGMHAGDRGSDMRGLSRPAPGRPAFPEQDLRDLPRRLDSGRYEQVGMRAHLQPGHA